MLIKSRTRVLWMHRHFTDAGCVLLFGVGSTWTPYGITARTRSAPDAGEAGDQKTFTPRFIGRWEFRHGWRMRLRKRPFDVTRDGEGIPIDELFA